MSGRTQDICCTPGCKNLQVVVDYNYNNSGLPGYRKWCQHCHDTRTAAKHGLKNVKEVVAKNAGFSSVLEYTQSMHPSLKHRKDYCENIDGRLGFKCTTTIVSLPGGWNGMLDVDHIDGDPSNDTPENYQTLCKCCHTYKGKINGDHATPGRKALGVSGKRSVVSSVNKMFA